MQKEELTGVGYRLVGSHKKWPRSRAAVEEGRQMALMSLIEIG